VLILRDVLGFTAAKAAQILGCTEDSVTNALKRARATLHPALLLGGHGEPPPPTPGSASERRLIDRLTQAYETGDVAGIVAQFTDDAWLTMPPMPLEYQGRDLIARFLAAVSFRDGRTYRLVATRANGQLAFGAYLRDPEAPIARANSLLVLTLTGNQIRAMTRSAGAHRQPGQDHDQIPGAGRSSAARGRVRPGDHRDRGRRGGLCQRPAAGAVGRPGRARGETDRAPGAAGDAHPPPATTSPPCWPAGRRARTRRSWPR
jgi:hypothetical protein